MLEEGKFYINSGRESRGRSFSLQNQLQKRRIPMPMRERLAGTYLSCLRILPPNCFAAELHH